MTGKDDNHLPYELENMSIPELEALLRKDFLASEDSAPDVDYTMAVVEVIQKKEQAQPDYQPLDTARAWEEFKTFFNTEEGRETSIYRSDEEDETACSNTEKQTSGHKKSKAFRRCVMIAASLCLLAAVTSIPVFGYHSIVQMLASWTAEQFGFYMPSETRSDPDSVPEEFAELQEIMQQLGVELIVPKFPEGFEAETPALDYFPENGTLEFTIMYQRERDYYIFVVNRDGDIIFNHYEKSNPLVETKVYNGIEHYFLENNGNSTAAWYVGTIEYHILTNQSTSELKEIVESMYDE